MADLIEPAGEIMVALRKESVDRNSTLSGSLAMAKGAWSNLVTGLANDSADLDTLINNFVESVVAATRQIIPTIGKALDGIGTLINEIVPVALDYIPKIIVEFLPKIAESAVGIVTSIGQAILLKSLTAE